MKQKLFICAIVIVIALLFAACEKWPEIEEGKAVKVIYARGEHVHAGDEITFYYRPIKDPPHTFQMNITYQDFSYEMRCLDYEVRDGIYKISFVTPDSVMSLYIFPEGDGTQPVPISFVVHDENEDPVRGALGALAGSWWMGGSEYGDSLFKEELAKNPDMVVFYRNRWFRYSFRDETRPIIEQEVDSLKAHAEENHHIYGVLASGYAILGELDSALVSMRKYLEHDDIHSEIASRAAMDLDTYSSIFGKEDRSEEWDIKQQMALRFPMNYTAEDYVQSRIYEREFKGEPDSTAEAIIEARIEEEPASYYLKSEYLAGIGDNSGAVEAAQGYVDAFEHGEIPPCGWYFSSRAPEMFIRVAKDHFEKGDYQKALVRAKTAIEYVNQDDVKGRYFAFSAKCNIAMDETSSAKEDIIQAVVKGAIEESKELLPEIYPNLQPEEALKAVFVEASELAPKAPDFVITTSDGDSISPGTAILCMDFWNPGCGPCVAEMPLLSKFAGNRQDSRIRFLSITAAPSEHFQTTEYPMDNWELCPSNRQVFIDMKVGAIPHFFLVDERGHVRFNQIGAPLDTLSVGLLLDMLLAEGELAKGEAEPSD
jgi:thiol-disulfide isomerase/thioredoxin